MKLESLILLATGGAVAYFVLRDRSFGTPASMSVPVPSDPAIVPQGQTPAPLPFYKQVFQPVTDWIAPPVQPAPVQQTPAPAPQVSEPLPIFNPLAPQGQVPTPPQPLPPITSAGFERWVDMPPTKDRFGPFSIDPPECASTRPAPGQTASPEHLECLVKKQRECKAQGGMTVSDKSNHMQMYCIDPITAHPFSTLQADCYEVHGLPRTGPTGIHTLMIKPYHVRQTRCEGTGPGWRYGKRCLYTCAPKRG